jgi:hypothetical protein
MIIVEEDFPIFPNIQCGIRRRDVLLAAPQVIQGDLNIYSLLINACGRDLPSLFMSSGKAKTFRGRHKDRIARVTVELRPIFESTPGFIFQAHGMSEFVASFVHASVLL